MGFSKAILYSITDLKIGELKKIDLTEYVLSESEDRLANKAVQWCQEKSVVSFCQDDSDYHFKLGFVSASPYIVYMLGNVELLNQNIMAIVGPRKASSYATHVMESLFVSLRDYNVVTISGLAEGVDQMCHDMSIKSNIPTIAVLGGGLKYYLEGKNRELIQRIVDNGGLVLSEFKLNSKPEKYTFPQRNRIVAGLSDMVFLPEASEKSGSLITVDFARQMHKDVYGTPNTIFSSTSKGLHQYMQQGFVSPVSDWEWMLTRYFGKRQQVKSNKQQVVEENLFQGEFSVVVEVLQQYSDGLKLEELVRQTNLGVEEVMSDLSVAEVMGRVRNDGGVWKKTM